MLFSAIFLAGFGTYHFSKNYLKSVQFYFESVRNDMNKVPVNVSTGDATRAYVSSTSYPLAIEAYQLTKYNYVAGSGHIGSVCSALTILDRTGNLFTFANGQINQFFKIDNNFADFALNYRADDPLMLRAHSFASLDDTFFVAYTRFNRDKTFSFVISELKVECGKNTKVTAYRDVFVTDVSESEALNSQGMGGALLIHDGDLLFSFGISSVDKRHMLDRDDDRILRGTTYLYSSDTKSVRQFTGGHRNITALMKVNDGIYSVEHGEKGGDEVNILNDGADYGYPFYSFGTKYGSYEELVTREEKYLAPETNEVSFPIYAYLPSIAPSDAIYFNKSNDFENWESSILVTGLKSQSLFILKLMEGRPVYSEQIFIGNRLRSVEQYGNAIWVLTDDGQLLKISKNKQRDTQSKIKTSLKALHPSLKKCIQCHNLDPIENDHAPHLASIIGRPIASLEFNYSSGLLEHKDKKWDKTTFIKYIQNPYNLSENSKMPNIGISYLDAVTIFRMLQE
jgi:cytochrome c2